MGVADAATARSAGARSLPKGMLASASGTAALQACSASLSFVLALLLARLMGTVAYGRYALAFAWATFLTTPALLGFDRLLVRDLAAFEVQRRWGPMKGLLRRASQLVLLASLATGLVGAAVALLWLSPREGVPLCVAMLIVPLTSLCLLRQSAMQAMGQVVRGQLPEYLVRPLAILAGVLALHIFAGHALSASTALLANAVGVAVALLVGAGLARRARPSALRAARRTFDTAVWLRASLPMMLINGIWMANGYVAILLVGAFAGPREAGIYNVVQKGGELIVLVLFAANMPLAPALARLRARGDRHGLEQTTERVARATTMVSAPVAGAFIVLPTLYLGLFGAGFRTGATALAIVAAGQLANALAGPSGNVLLMTGHERAAARGVAVGLLANLVLALLLIPPLGVTGGAIAFSSSLVLWNVLLVAIARRRLGVNVTALRWLAMTGRASTEGWPAGDWLDVAALSAPPLPAQGGKARGE